VTRVGVARAAGIGAGIAAIAVARRLQTQLDRYGRRPRAKPVETRCECDEHCGASIRVPRALFHERDVLRLEQRFVANGHAHGAEGDAVHAFKRYQVIEPRSAPRGLFWARDPWS
jgi:hypothetical protein